jgi:hypothetical protein
LPRPPGGGDGRREPAPPAPARAGRAADRARRHDPARPGRAAEAEVELEDTLRDGQDQDLAVEARRAEVRRLRAEGWSVRRIATQLHIGYGTVRRDIAETPGAAAIEFAIALFARVDRPAVDQGSVSLDELRQLLSTFQVLADTPRPLLVADENTPTARRPAATPASRRSAVWCLIAIASHLIPIVSTASTGSAIRRTRTHPRRHAGAWSSRSRRQY